MPLSSFGICARCDNLRDYGNVCAVGHSVKPPPKACTDCTDTEDAPPREDRWIGFDGHSDC